MAITAGTGTTVAADEVTDGTLGTAKVQYMKIMDGTLDGTAKAAVNSVGGLVVVGYAYPATTGTITTSTSAVTTGAIGIAGNATISISGTYAGVNATFEASDDGGTTYFPISAVREDTGIAETTTGVLTANTSRIWTTAAPGFTNIRVRATAYTSGTANVRISPGSYPFEPNVSAVPPTPQTGTVTSVGGNVTADTLILAANPARQGATIFNDSTAQLTLLVGSGTQSATVFTTKIASQQYYEVPFRYVGRISGQWAAANGSARITEYT